MLMNKLPAEKRLPIHLSVLREAFLSGEIDNVLSTVNEANLVDGLATPTANKALRHFLQTRILDMTLEWQIAANEREKREEERVK
ncbi:hypothetical protein FVE85_9686 [Porphyridium purpureum]|uniref:Uncharacterized protein n=1 Tax=Porphyridium purpureum TaxID=35688 RepID=A0A5J4YJQ3_PORPP|nr:hypothetical protein FVE85_9686 [Porphyridium purpureum]|eukprot:POR4437..scf246_12